MCTVTWIPDGRGGAFLTSNRDEQPSRAAREFRKITTPQGEVLHFPVDAGAGGTWFCLSSHQRAVCLLNGGHRKHRHRPPYRRSRGLIVLEAFQFADFAAFLRDIDLRGIEPFTMILAAHGHASELIWNGRCKSIRHLAPGETAIWSSTTLYPASVRARRRSLFRRFLQTQPQPDLEAIIAFHQMDTGDSVHGFVMNRDNKVRTVSITAAALGRAVPYWMHYDLIHNQMYRHPLSEDDRS